MTHSPRWWNAIARLDVQAIAGKVFKEFHYEPVWWGVGYVLVGHAPD